MATWRLLGEVQPITTEWKSFPEASITSETFRLTFLYLPIRPRTWIWIRPYYIPEKFGIGPLQRVYPDSEPQIIEIPIPQSLRDEGMTVRDFQIKKGFRPRIGRQPDAPYVVRLEEL